MKSDNFWSCIYFAQSHAHPYLVKIGLAKRPETRVMDLSGKLPVQLTLIWFMRAQAPLSKQIMRKAFASLRTGEDWYRPTDKLKGFVRHCRAKNQVILTPDVIEKMLPSYATDPGTYADLAASYRAIFDAEYKYQQSNSGRFLRSTETIDRAVGRIRTDMN